MTLSPKAIARLTGLAYLAMLPTGIGFLLIRSRLVAATAKGTLENVAQHADLARLGLVVTMIVVIAQALAALGFHALFRATKPSVAVGIAAFGLVNSAAILAGTVASWTAIEIASAGPTADAATATLVHALYLFEGNAWKIGGIFFGLWLIPMGVGAITSDFFHAGRVLGWILVVGGVLYVISAFVAVSPRLVALGVHDWLAAPASVGEVWMMFALAIVGVRTRAAATQAEA
jgi:hypothetical protein